MSCWLRRWVIIRRRAACVACRRGEWGGVRPETPIEGSLWAAASLAVLALVVGPAARGRPGASPDPLRRRGAWRDSVAAGRFENMGGVTGTGLLAASGGFREKNLRLESSEILLTLKHS
jgi:hypothetical protein